VYVIHHLTRAVGYHKKGYPKQEPKRLLRPCKYQSQRTTTRSRLIFRFARGPAHKPHARGQLSASPRPSRLRPRPTRPRMGHGFSDSPEAPRIKPQTKYGFSDSLEAGSATTSSPPSRPTSLTKRHASNHSRNVSRTSTQYSRAADGTGDKTEKGLPATMLSTAPMTDARTTLCHLIPAPGTAQRGESGLGHYSLGISV